MPAPPSATVSVIVPVKDGARHLPALLAALARQPAHELLIVDSGSRDGSVALARAAGATVLEIPPASFRHGPTRNWAAERTGGELLCFLTQDAVPVDGWLAAIVDAFAADPRIGALFGPQLPRPDSSPMVARELETFFAAFSPDGTTTVDDQPRFLSNVNAAYRRACWEQLRFRDLAYAEDQAFARDLGPSAWRAAYVPAAAVVHAHDYGPVDFARRTFDEYRGLRAATGHREPFRPKAALGGALRLTRADRAWMRAHGWPRGRRAWWTGRALLHHGSRRVFAALGSRAERLPAPVRRALSLERRGD
ncbi:glycosyltransferase family 2 protein [Patulibacter defluvii]|uniref:glycosyltransferase family 2 protein n=1 Tax=Patulibacter defluvii TaxID=3095358 RepID=UPI002A74B6BE|nr:glycosyltransferase family 2 protein [Patulibacter sp. DM4]